MSFEIIAAGIDMSVGPVMKIGSSRPSKPSLKTSAAAAPDSSAFSSFCVNGQMPRWISAILPAAPAKSAGSQPLTDVPGRPGAGPRCSRPRNVGR